MERPQKKEVDYKCLNGDCSCVSFADGFNNCHDAYTEWMKSKEFEEGIESIIRSYECSELYNSESKIMVIAKSICKHIQGVK